MKIVNPNEDLRTELYHAYYSKVLSYAKSHINNYEDAEDVASDVFVKVYKNLDAYDQNKASLSTWIFSITRNEVIDYYRKRRLSYSLDEAINQSDDSEEKLDKTMLLGELAKELSKLPEKQRDAVILFYCYGLSHKEIAEKMNISYDSARKMCSLAIQQLRQKMTNCEV